jgi:hypothetical protein
MFTGFGRENQLGIGQIAGPSTALRSGRDDKVRVAFSDECSCLGKSSTLTLSSREAVTFLISALRLVPQGRAELSPGRSPGESDER